MELIDKAWEWGERHYKIVAIVAFIIVCILNH